MPGNPNAIAQRPRTSVPCLLSTVNASSLLEYMTPPSGISKTASRVVWNRIRCLKCTNHPLFHPATDDDEVQDIC